MAEDGVLELELRNAPTPGEQTDETNQEEVRERSQGARDATDQRHSTRNRVLEPHTQSWAPVSARWGTVAGGVASTANVIVAERLTKSYGRKRGVIDLDFAVPPGQLFGYLGPIGAGKTTTIRTRLDLIRPTFQAQIVIVRVRASPGREAHHQFPTVLP